MDRPNTRPVTETRGAYRQVALFCLRIHMARDTNHDIRRTSRQSSGLVCCAVSTTLDVELPIKLAHSLLKWGMLQVVVGGRLERMSEEKDFRVAKELAREMQRARRTSIKSARHTHDRMTGAVGERLPASDEEVEIAKGLVHLFHHAGTKAVRLYECHGGSEIGAADFDGPGAHLGPFFDLREQPAACGVIEERGSFGIADEVDGGDGDVR